MKIGIDVSRLASSQWTGVETYTYEIIRQLMVQIPAEHTVELYTPQSVLHTLPTLPDNWQEKVLRWPPKRLWTHLRLSLRMVTHKPDVLFIPGHVMPLIHPKKTVAVIHDIAAKAFPESYSQFERWYTLFAAKFAMQFAAHVVVPSAFTKQELERLPHVKKASIQVIPHGYSSVSKNSNDVSTTSTPYLLMLGRLESKKNVVRVIRAFTQWKHEGGDPQTTLVLAGKKGVGYEDIMLARTHSPNAADIIVKGYVTEQERQSLLRHAKALVYPSIYEGFGLPILEAFDAHTPVITSRGTSTGEVAGSAALLVDPFSVDDIERALKQVADPQIAQMLTQRGTERLADFSWQKTGTLTAALLLQ